MFDKSIFKTKIEKGTPFERYITKAIEQTSKFSQGITKSRQKKNKNTSCNWYFKFFFLSAFIYFWSAFSNVLCEF